MLLHIYEVHVLHADGKMAHLPEYRQVRLKKLFAHELLNLHCAATIMCSNFKTCGWAGAASCRHSSSDHCEASDIDGVFCTSPAIPRTGCAASARLSCTTSAAAALPADLYRAFEPSASSEFTPNSITDEAPTMAMTSAVLSRACTTHHICITSNT